MKKYYEAPTLFCDEFMPNTMIASCDMSIVNGTNCEATCNCTNTADGNVALLGKLIDGYFCMPYGC